MLPERLDGALCSVIDVLRATTTIITSLASGASEVRPFSSAAEARQAARSVATGTYLLGGEEGGKRIPGFDLGNSPLEYTPQAVKDKSILFATTNGTPALKRTYATRPHAVYVGALINVSVLSLKMVNAALRLGKARIFFVCSGTGGRPSTEDFFCAGLAAEKVTRRLLQSGAQPNPGNQATAAIELADANQAKPLEVLRSSPHGRYLLSLGFARDLDFASQLDSHPLVPIFNGTSVVASPID